MIEVTRTVTSKELFGKSSFHYERRGLREFIHVDDSPQFLIQKAGGLGLEISTLRVADLETIWRIQAPGARIGEERLILHEIHGDFWVVADQAEMYNKLFEKGLL